MIKLRCIEKKESENNVFTALFVVESTTEMSASGSIICSLPSLDTVDVGKSYDFNLQEV